MSQMLAAGALGIFLFGAAVLVLLAIGAMVLRTACGLVGVEEPPSFGYAIVILLVAGFAQSIVLAPFYWIGLDYTVIQLVVSAGISSFVYSLMVPVSLARGFFVWIAQAIIGTAVIIGLGMVMALLGSAMM